MVQRYFGQPLRLSLATRSFTSLGVRSKHLMFVPVIERSVDMLCLSKSSADFKRGLIDLEVRLSFR